MESTENSQKWFKPAVEELDRVMPKSQKGAWIGKIGED